MPRRDAKYSLCEEAGCSEDIATLRSARALCEDDEAIKGVSLHSHYHALAYDGMGRSKDPRTRLEFLRIPFRFLCEASDARTRSVDGKIR